MQIKLRLKVAQLSTKKSEIQEHLSASKEQLYTIYNSIDPKYHPIRDDISQSVALIDSQLIDHSGGVSPKFFLQILEKIDDIKTQLEQIIAQKLQEFDFIRNFIIFTIIIANIFLFLSYKTILKFQREWLDKYFKVEHERDNLEQLYVDLKRAQVLIDRYIPISQTDLKGNITYVNQAMCNLTKYPKEALVGKNHRILRYSPKQKEQFKQMWSEITQGKMWEDEVINRAKDGTIFWVYIHIHPIFDDKNHIMGYQALREDITDKKNLEFLSSHDKLTSIYNRAKFDELLEQAIREYKQEGLLFSLAILDIDHFKKVNDNYGHLVGDSVLIESVKSIKDTIRRSDILARWGGEEFVLLLPNTSIKEAKSILEKIRASIEATTFEKVGHITISAGVSQMSREETSTTLLKKIDDALYEAKESGRNRVVVA
jgi:diguanylate cyclase (GGDEF)-like protein/PAS domain S-box-containing protein